MYVFCTGVQWISHCTLCLLHATINLGRPGRALSLPSWRIPRCRRTACPPRCTRPRRPGRTRRTDSIRTCPAPGPADRRPGRADTGSRRIRFPDTADRCAWPPRRRPFRRRTPQRPSRPARRPRRSRSGGGSTASRLRRLYRYRYRYDRPW